MFRRLVLCCFVVLSACSTPKSHTVLSKVKILEQKIVDAESAQGVPIKKLILRWKNTGQVPITYIDASIDTLDAEGNVTDHNDDVSLYVLGDPIQPGQEHNDNPVGPREGVWMYQKTAGPPVSARITITAAGSDSEG